MDWASLKDMDVKDLLAKLKCSQAIFTDKKMLSKFGIIFGSVIIFLIFYHYWFNPKIIQPQKKEIVKMEVMKTKTTKMINSNRSSGPRTGVIRKVWISACRIYA